MHLNISLSKKEVQKEQDKFWMHVNCIRADNRLFRADDRVDRPRSKLQDLHAVSCRAIGGQDTEVMYR